ncbi:MAG: ATP/GTP-binding protein [Gammaproteobacteria bacterium]
MAQLKFIFTGTPNVGKTTAISTISEFEPITTEVATTDNLAAVKSETTAAMDYGEVSLENGIKLRLYGTPGQKRFSFMWEILTEGALGLIILVDNSHANPLDDLDTYLENFSTFIESTGVVVGITRYEHNPTPNLDQYYEHVMQKYGQNYPIFPVDIRKKEDVLLLLDALIATLEVS